MRTSPTLAGLTIACFALQKALGHTPRTKIDGFTPEQRVFLAWAQIWREPPRAGGAVPHLEMNLQSSGKWRVDGPLANMPEFSAAWGCREGTPMVRPDSLRARIWYHLRSANS